MHQHQGIQARRSGQYRRPGTYRARLERRSRRGKLFFGCGRYPKCKFASWDRVVAQPCPQCGSAYLVEKVTKREGARWQCPNKECGYQTAVETPASPAPEAAPPGA